jgi:uncharacterized repeat protein (TIGR03803 family)
VVVTGTNGDQATSYTARLQFVTAPQLSRQPASLTAPAGFTAKFRGRASGGLLNFRWRFNGTNLADGNDFRGVFTPELAVVSAQPSTAGGYQLLVTNLAGSATSVVATLTVAQIAAELPGVRLTTLASFVDPDGNSPASHLAVGSDGMLYGTTRAGGTNDGGTFFRLTTNGTLTVLCAFPDRNGQPNGGLAEGAPGHFYGTTSQGGTNHCGTVFEATSNAVTTLYSFGSVRDENGNALDGAYLYGGLVLGTDGNLYGATAAGGSPDSWGTVFRITPAGSLTTLVSFHGPNGGAPNAQLLAASDGKLYGTTLYGGIGYVDAQLNNGFGTVFQMTTNGVLTTLVSFNGNTTGGEQDKELVQTSDGTFYGTTEIGGASNCGTLFRLTVAANATPAPVLQGVQREAGMVTFSWSAVAGRNYQVQFKTNLNQAVWSNLSAPLEATNATASASDLLAAGRQRFYRVVLLP